MQEQASVDDDTQANGELQIWLDQNEDCILNQFVNDLKRIIAEVEEQHRIPTADFRVLRDELIGNRSVGTQFLNRNYAGRVGATIIQLRMVQTIEEQLQNSNYHWTRASVRLSRKRLSKNWRRFRFIATGCRHEVVFAGAISDTLSLLPRECSSDKSAQCAANIIVQMHQTLRSDQKPGDTSASVLTELISQELSTLRATTCELTRNEVDLELLKRRLKLILAYDRLTTIDTLLTILVKTQASD